MKITTENRGNVLSVRAKLRKALAVSDVDLTKTDRTAIERIVSNLDKALAPAQKQADTGDDTAPATA